MIKFFVCGSVATGHNEAVLARNWLPIAARRYVENPDAPPRDRHEVRLVTRLTDFEWMPGLTFVRGADFGRCPTCGGKGTLGKASACHICDGSGKNPEAAKFEALIASGQGRWWQEPDELVHGDEELA